MVKEARDFKFALLTAKIPQRRHHRSSLMKNTLFWTTPFLKWSKGVRCLHSSKQHKLAASDTTNSNKYGSMQLCTIPPSIAVFSFWFRTAHFDQWLQVPVCWLCHQYYTCCLLYKNKPRTLSVAVRSARHTTLCAVLRGLPFPFWTTGSRGQWTLGKSPRCQSGCNISIHCITALKDPVVHCFFLTCLVLLYDAKSASRFLATRAVLFFPTNKQE